MARVRTNSFSPCGLAQDTRNCLILGHDRLIATNRLRDLVVVETPDSVFISDLEHSRDVKSIVDELKVQQRGEYRQHRSAYYPWGISNRLEHKDNYATSRLTVYPRSSLELPLKPNTAYHLFILEGRAKIITGSEKKTLGPGEAITCSAKEQVRIENAATTELSLIQIEI